MLRHVLIAAIAATILVGGIVYTNRFGDWMHRTSEHTTEDARTWRACKRLLKANPPNVTEDWRKNARTTAIRDLKTLEQRHPEWAGKDDPETD